MKFSKREQMLLMIVPAVVTAAAYNWYFVRPASKSLSDARAELAKLEQSAPAENELMSKQNVLTTMKQELAAERQRAERLRTGARRFTAGFGTASGQARALQNLAEIFAARQISLIKSSWRSDAVPKDIEAFCKKQEFSSPQLWKIEAVGSYENMLRALNALSYSHECMIPISVEMESANSQNEGESLKKWALTFWM